MFTQYLLFLSRVARMVFFVGLSFAVHLLVLTLLQKGHLLLGVPIFFILPLIFFLDFDQVDDHLPRKWWFCMGPFAPILLVVLKEGSFGKRPE